VDTHDRGRPRIVVTGYGAVTCLGLDADASWRNLVSGTSGIRRVESFDVSDMPITIAGEIREFDPVASLGPQWAYIGDRYVQIAQAATLQALGHAGLDAEGPEARAAAVVIANAHGFTAAWGKAAQPLIAEHGYDGMDQVELLEGIRDYMEQHYMEPGAVYDHDVFARMMYNHQTKVVSARLQTTGPCFSVSSACMSGAKSIDRATRYLRHGHAEVALAGGTEACVARYAIFFLHAMKALTTDCDTPEEASRPFDQGRSGFVLSEGCGILCLETLAHARRRGATILAEVMGNGSSNNANSLFAPEDDGGGSAGSMKAALRDGGVDPATVDAVFAHATATGVGDPAEAEAIRLTLGDAAADASVTAPKSMMGHAIAASGAIAAINSVQAINDGVIPPVLNLTDPDPECTRGLDIVRDEARERRVNCVLNNAFGFGGTNAAHVFRRFTD